MPGPVDDILPRASLSGTCCIIDSEPSDPVPFAVIEIEVEDCPERFKPTEGLKCDHGLGAFPALRAVAACTADEPFGRRSDANIKMAMRHGITGKTHDLVEAADPCKGRLKL